MKIKNVKTRLMIVDDHEVVRNGLINFLSTDESIELIFVASDASSAINAIKKSKPDVILLDFFLPDVPALETIKKIKFISPNTKIILITSHEGSEHVKYSIEAGALSYLLKDISPGILIEAIKQAAIDKSVFSPRIAEIALQASNAPKAVTLTPNFLTKREIEIVKFIANGLSNYVIADKLNISEKTVKCHVGNILSKLYLNDRTQIAIHAWREGWSRY